MNDIGWLRRISRRAVLVLACACASHVCHARPTGQRTSVEKDGITWTFSEAVPVGTFVNGDFYVVGPVTVVSIEPQPGSGRNGSVLNIPPDQSASGFDDRVSAGRYDSSLTAMPPIDMEPGDVLISSISLDTLNQFDNWLNPHGNSSESPVRSVSILTCLDTEAPADAFRPSYCGRFTELYRAGSLRRDLLPRLQKVDATVDIGEWAEHFRRPWLDVCFFAFDAATEYQAVYGRETGRTVGMAALLLTLDFTEEEKEPLLLNFVQYGIDLWGIAEAGYPGWQAHGGHGSGRKLPVVFAGIMLGDERMASPTTTYPDLKFGEDMQTMYDQCWTGANVVYAGHVGSDGSPGNEGWRAYEHVPPSQWVNSIGEDYRRCCTSIAWVGQALALRIMHAESLWAHDAFFDYIDRWMTEDDSVFVEEILAATGNDYSADWSRQGQCWDGFVEQMWAKYRNDLPGEILRRETEASPAIVSFSRQGKNVTITFPPGENISCHIFDIRGRMVWSAAHGPGQNGTAHIVWSAENTTGAPVPSGMYLCRVQTGNNRYVWKADANR